MNLVDTGVLTPGKSAYDALEPTDGGGRKHVENGRQLASAEGAMESRPNVYCRP